MGKIWWYQIQFAQVIKDHHPINYRPIQLTNRCYGLLRLPLQPVEIMIAVSILYLLFMLYARFSRKKKYV